MMKADADSAYLDGFMGGVEFVLLAIEGRGLVTPEVDAFRQDYRRILEIYRASRTTLGAPSGALLQLLRN